MHKRPWKHIPSSSTSDLAPGARKLEWMLIWNLKDDSFKLDGVRRNFRKRKTTSKSIVEKVSECFLGTKYKRYGGGIRKQRSSSTGKNVTWKVIQQIVWKAGSEIWLKQFAVEKESSGSKVDNQP